MFYKKFFKLNTKISKNFPPSIWRAKSPRLQNPKQSTLQVLGKKRGGEDLVTSNEEGQPYIPSSLELYTP